MYYILNILISVHIPLYNCIKLIKISFILIIVNQYCQATYVL